MADMSERHEIRVRGADHSFVFVADSSDGRLVIRQESAGKEPREMCAITLANPEELRTPEAEADVRRRFQSGQSVAEIAGVHKRSARAIELRLQRLGLVEPDPKNV